MLLIWTISLYGPSSSFGWKKTKSPMDPLEVSDLWWSPTHHGSDELPANLVLSEMKD